MKIAAHIATWCIFGWEAELVMGNPPRNSEVVGSRNSEMVGSWNSEASGLRNSEMVGSRNSEAVGSRNSEAVGSRSSVDVFTALLVSLSPLSSSGFHQLDPRCTSAAALKISFHHII